MKRKTLAIALGATLSASLAATAQADKLDDIIESGKLRCAVTLDFPPMGFLFPSSMKEWQDEKNRDRGCGDGGFFGRCGARFYFE